MSRRIVFAGSVVCAALAGFVWLRYFMRDPYANDFRVFYFSAHVGVTDGWAHIYDLDRVRAAAAWLGGKDAVINSQSSYVNTPLFVWVLSPLTALPLAAAYVVWAAVSLAAFVATWRVAAPWSGLDRVSLLLYSIPFWPVFVSLWMGQPSIVTVAFAALAWWFLAKERPWIAGALLAVATVLKPQEVFLVPIVLLASGRTRPFLGWLAAGALFAALFVISLGPAGVQSYIVEIQYTESDPVHRLLTPALVFGPGAVTIAIEILFVAAALVAARRQAASLETVCAIGLTASLMASPHVHETDFTAALLAAWLVLRSGSPSRERRWLLGAGVVAAEIVMVGQPLPLLLWQPAWLAHLGWRRSRPGVPR